MKSFLLFLILSISVYAQIKNVSPYLNSEDLYSIAFHDNIGWAGGKNGTLLFTNDGGVTWSKKQSIISESIKKIFYPGDKAAYFLVDSQYTYKMYRTIDTGRTFEKLSLPEYSYFYLNFLNDSTCFTHDSHFIYNTTDYGNNWNIINGDISQWGFRGVSFIDEQRGFATKEDTLYKTNNGGISWEIINSSFANGPLGFVHFFNADTGIVFVVYIDGYQGMRRTTDGGLTWKNSEDSQDILSLHFFGNYIFMTEGYRQNSGYGEIEYSTDAGETWNQIKTDSRFQLHDIFYKSRDSIFVVGLDGYFMKLSLPGTFTPLDGDFLWGITSVNEKTVLAVGENGTILKSTDEGINWRKINSGSSDFLDNIEFRENSPKGIILGRKTALRTTDAGETWDTFYVPIHPTFYNFSGTSDIWIGNDSSLFLSTDDGSSWVNKTFKPIHYLSASFINENTGWIGGSSGNEFINVIFYTTDKGSHWFQMAAPYNGTLFIKFFNDSIGLAGSDDFSKTTNSGNSWFSLPTIGGDEVTSFCFADSTTYYLIDRDFVSYRLKMYLIKLSSSGENKILDAWDSAMDYYGGISFKSKNEGWAAYWKKIQRIKFIPTDVKEEITSPNIPDKFILKQNYPNPFNPATTISFEVPKESFVKIHIYNIAGEEIAVLLNELKSAGSYSISWNGKNYSGNKVPSGIYFNRMEAGSFSAVNKMLLLK